MTKQKKKLPHILLSALGLVLCVVFGFMLICNITIIVKGTIAPERPPAVFGVTPMVVLSGSMSGNAEDHIEVGDLIFVGPAEPDELQEGDVIAFMEENSPSTKTNAFCLGIILCNVSRSFDYLIYPYYPAYTS